MCAVRRLASSLAEENAFMFPYARQKEHAPRNERGVSENHSTTEIVKEKKVQSVVNRATPVV